MSISAPTYSDPDRLVPFLSSERADTAAEAREAAKNGGKKELTAFAEGNDNPSFWDVLDVINPLQHIPVVNNIYREMTGDQIGVAARVAGGTLFGGPIGLVASAIDCMVEAETGENMGGHALAMFRDPATAPDTAIAQADTAKSTESSKSAQSVQTAKAVSPVSIPDISLPPDAGKGAEKIAAGSANPAAPQSLTVTLPDMASDTNDLSRVNMAFGLDGTVSNKSVVTPPAASVISPASAINPTAVSSAAPRPAVEAVAGSATQMQALVNPPKVMPVPERKVFAAGNGPAPLSVPLSSGSGRSNVPVTGRDPVSARTGAATNLAVQRAMAQQGVANVQHPMLPSADGSTRVNTGGNDWFTSAFTQAMDKYQKSSNLGQQQTATTTPAAPPATNLY